MNTDMFWAYVRGSEPNMPQVDYSLPRLPTHKFQPSGYGDACIAIDEDDNLTCWLPEDAHIGKE